MPKVTRVEIVKLDSKKILDGMKDHEARFEVE